MWIWWSGVHHLDSNLLKCYSIRFDFRFFDIPNGVILPKIRSCSEVYGRMADGPLAETRISGVIN